MDTEDWIPVRFPPAYVKLSAASSAVPVPRNVIFCSVPPLQLKS